MDNILQIAGVLSSFTLYFVRDFMFYSWRVGFSKSYSNIKYILNHCLEMVCWNLLFVCTLALFAASDACRGCPCGYYCPDPLLRYKHPVICPIGYYCPTGAYNKTSFAKKCTAGSLCPKTGLCTPEPCPCGYYCPSGSSVPKPCPVDHYCPANSAKPKNCTTKSLCPNSRQCAPYKTSGKPGTTPPPVCVPKPSCDPLHPPPGYICSTDPTIGCGLICYDPSVCQPPPPPLTVAKTTPKNLVSHPPTTTPRPTTPPPPCRTCPPGLWVAQYCADDCDNYQCGPCQEGRYCPRYDGTSTLCPAGYYCPLGSSAPTPCPANSYCVLGSKAATPCPTGKKSPPGTKGPLGCV